MKNLNAALSEKPAWSINGRFMAQRMTGVQRYAYEIVAAMGKIYSSNPEIASRLKLQIIFPPSVNVSTTFPGIDARSTTFGSGHLWDQLMLPWFAKSGVLSLGNLGPLLLRNHIVCIHDANTFIEPESYSRSFGLVYRTILPLIGRRASRVATVSQFSANMLTKYRVCRPEKLFVAPNGHEHALTWDAGRAQLRLLKDLKRPYVLLIGSRAKHKNIGLILDQASALDAAGLDIVVVGGTTGIFSKSTLDDQKANVHFTGYVDDNDLAALYENALCLAFPSLTEGFGIPPLEAMARGCAVISSYAASLIEVGGDAVAYLDPTNGEAWREAIVALSRNWDLRAEMIARGRKRVALFSWSNSAQTYIDEILQNGSPSTRKLFGTYRS